MRKNEEIDKKMNEEFDARMLNIARNNPKFCAYYKAKCPEKFNLKESTEKNTVLKAPSAEMLDTSRGSESSNEKSNTSGSIQDADLSQEEQIRLVTSEGDKGSPLYFLKK